MKERVSSLVVHRTQLLAGCGWVGRMLCLVACCLLVALGAQLKITLPGTDVPLTLQAFAVLLAGFVLRADWAAASMVFYVTLGSVGLPVFAPGSGGVTGLTGGYLIGFVAAAWLVARLKGPSSAGFARLVAVAAAGMVVIFCFGLMVRVLYMSGDWQFAWHSGVLPFIPSAIVEAFLAAILARTFRSFNQQ